jgi:sugar phosphate isomerase/epimerase
MPSGFSFSRGGRRHFLSRVVRYSAGLPLMTTGLSLLDFPKVLADKPRQTAGKEGNSEAWRLRQAASSIAFSSLPIESAIARIAELGFDAIDIWSAHAGCPHLDDVLHRLGPEGLLPLLEKHHLSLYSFSVYKGGYRKYAELLGQCGGGIAVRGSEGGLPGSFEETKTRMKRFVESLKPDLELCEKYDSRLAIENHANALLHTLDSMKLFVETASDHPRLGIALAPYHVQSLPNQPVREAIRIGGERLFFIYMWQKPASGETPEGQLPGIGPVDVTPWLAELRRIDYCYPVTPFMHHEPEPERMATLLKRSKKYLASRAARLSG